MQSRGSKPQKIPLSFIQGLSAWLVMVSEAVGIAWTSAWMTRGTICPDGARLILRESIGGLVTSEVTSGRKLGKEPAWGPYFDPFVGSLKPLDIIRCN